MAHENNKGPLHFGMDSGGKICFGAGPVRLKFTHMEAVELVDQLNMLLSGREMPCGCGPAKAQSGMAGKDAPGFRLWLVGLHLRYLLAVFSGWGREADDGGHGGEQALLLELRAFPAAA